MAPLREASNILLFGDQTVPKLPIIRALIDYAQNSAFVRSFLNGATDAVQLEVAKLLPEERTCFRAFDSLLGLAEDNDQASEPSEMVATVLMGIGRLGELLMHAEERPSILASYLEPTRILAFCTGEIPAAVAAAATDCIQLLALAIETVGILVRFASEVIRRSQAIDSTPESWATTLVGVSTEKTQQLLDGFHREHAIPPFRHVVISVVAKGWLTLFGPPSTIRRLWASSPQLEACPKISTDARGAVHMSHLPELDVDYILGGSALLDTPVSVTKARMLSPCACSMYEAGTVRELLRLVIPDITQNAYYPEDTITKLLDDLQAHHDNPEVVVTVMGQTTSLPLVQRAFEVRGLNYRLHEHSSAASGIADSASSGSPAATRRGSDLVAIVGMSGRFPGSSNVQDYWESLVRGQSFISEIPASRFDLAQFYDATHQTKNSTAARHGAFLDQPGLFDYHLFNMSPREAAQTDPLQRLYLTVAYEALEMSGYYPDATPATARNRIATYFGQCSDDWRDTVPGSESGTDVYWTPGTVRAFTPSRLNYHFKFGGGSYSIDNACASSTTCVALACSALLAHECDTALAGGGSILSSPYPYAALSRAKMVSLTGGCRTFHDDADGYCRGEGVGCVVLKRLEDAEADNDNVLGVICGSARSYSNTATSMTHPSAEAQQRLYLQVLRKANIRPEEIAYVELHGTGTQAGDSVEMSSILNVFADRRTKDNPLVIGAVKANIGHGEAAAGISSLIKTLLMLRYQRVPPQPGMPFKVNTRFPDLAKLNVYIAAKGISLRSSKVSAGRKRLFVNSFDASGGNTCLAIEDSPPRKDKAKDPRSYHVVSVSAKTPTSLLNNKKRLLEFLMRNPATPVADIGYTTTARRMHEQLRSAFSATSTRELIPALEADIKQHDAASIPPKVSPRGTARNVVFAFTGQGSQYVGMGRVLFQTHPGFRRLLESYQQTVSTLGLPQEAVHFLDIICEDDRDLATQPAAKVQLALVALEIALARIWISYGVKPNVLIGHSLGEYAALCVGGVLSVSDTLFLVASRAIMMQERLTAGSYAMLVVRGGAQDLSRQLSKQDFGTCQISLKNAPEMTVVSGTQEDVQRLRTHLQSVNLKTTLLQLPYGFHSGQLDPILDQFESSAQGVTFSRPKIPIVSSLRVTVVDDTATFSAKYLRDQARQPVDYVGALRAARDAGVVHENTDFIEIGPQPVCSSFIGATLRAGADTMLATLRAGEDPWLSISRALVTLYSAGYFIDWPEYHRHFAGSVSLLELPTYAFDETEFWTPFQLERSEQTPPPPANASPKAELSGLGSSSSLQYIKEIRMEDGGNQILATFQSFTSDPNLLEAIQGHQVNGFPVLPVSFYCDMALSAATCIYESLYPGTPQPQFALHSVEISSAITARASDTAQVIEVTAELSKESHSCKITFSSGTSDNKSRKMNGSCEVLFEGTVGQQADASRTLLLIKSRIRTLKAEAGRGTVHRMLKPVVYRLLHHVVQYGQRYQATDEIVLDTQALDAVGQISLSAEAAPARLLNAYWADSISHAAPVILNCGFTFGEDVACITDGFESWRMLETLRSGTCYTTYAHFEMTAKNSIIIGDVYTFDGDILVSTLKGLRFHVMKKTTLTTLLSKNLSAATGALQHTSTLGHSIAPTITHQESKRDHSFNLGMSGTRKEAGSPSEAGNQGMTYEAELVGPDVVAQFLAALEVETGLSLSGVSPSTEFADMGVDSLMAITTIAAFQRSSGIELTATFFIEHDTIEKATTALTAMNVTQAEASTKAPTSGFTTWRPKPVEREPPCATQAPNMSSDVPPTPLSEQSDPWVAVSPEGKESSPGTPVTPTEAKSITLHGKSTSVEFPLFLLADETGSISTYIQLPQLPHGRRVIGIESPFDKDPTSLHSIDELANLSLSAIRREQPIGPYSLGGFSMGGMVAYEVTRKLLAAGDPVTSLFILDMPVTKPSELQLRPEIEDVRSTGLVGGSRRSSKSQWAVPQGQQEYVRQMIRAASTYEPSPVEGSNRPKETVVVRANGGLMDVPEPSVSESIRWVRSSWEASSAAAWERLVGPIDYHEIDADHHSLMNYPKAKELLKILVRTRKGLA